MEKAKKSSIFLLGVLVVILSITAYTSIMTVWNTNPNIERSEEIVEIIRDPTRPKLSATYEYNLTINNLPSSGFTWVDQEGEPWLSGSGTAGDPYLIDGDTIMFNNSDNGQFACINISNSHDIYFKISGVTVRNNASDVGIGISIANSTNGAIINVNASYNGDDGIYLVNSHNITIDDSDMRDNHHDGLNMDNCTLCTISNSTLRYNLYNAYLSNCTYNVFQEECYFTDASYAGLVFTDSDENNVTECFLYNSTNGAIGIYDSDNLTITSNQLEDANFGITILLENGDCNNSVFYNNSFVDFLVNAYDNGSYNIWDNGVDLGNYWDDYSGVDADDDGIGDTPYTITGLSPTNPEDRYPQWDDGDSIAPVITIVHPDATVIYTTIPSYSLTIVEAGGIYNRWYTLDGGLHNTTFTGTTGTISRADWERLSGIGGQIITIEVRFSVNDTNGNIGSALVRIKKYIPESIEHGEDSEDVYMYALSKNQIYILLAFSFSLSLILRWLTLRATRKR